MQQRDIMPQVRNHISSRIANSGSLFEEQLFLPSAFDAGQRSKFSLEALAAIESSLCEGAAFDAINHVRQQVKALDTLLVHKRVHCRGQDQMTRANAQITWITSRRQLWINHYNTNQKAIISLGLVQSARSFPPLSVDDTFRNPTTSKQALGDSRHKDGALWTAGLLVPAVTSSNLPQDALSQLPRESVIDVGTQSAKNRSESCISFVW
jgi:hypothetical protein